MCLKPKKDTNLYCNCKRNHYYTTKSECITKLYRSGEYNIIYIITIYTYMPRIWKKEQLILNRIARKKLSKVEDIKDLQEAKAEIKAINPNGGCPAKYNSLEELETLMLEYFSEVKQEKSHPTITGLALKLWVDRQTISDYAKKDMFAPAIKQAKQFILNYTEQLILSKDKFTPGQIFYLKNNYKNDYKEKIEVAGNLNHSISLVNLYNLSQNISDSEIIDSESLKNIGDKPNL